MADFRADQEIVTKFLLDTCVLRQRLNTDTLQSLIDSAMLATQRSPSDDKETAYIPLTTGSAAEFYIEPMLSCVGDHDVMSYFNDELAIPPGTAPPTELPDEFHNRVEVYEIVDSEFPGYVYLVSSYLLTESIDDGKYSAVECERWYLSYGSDDETHGPARVFRWSNTLPQLYDRLSGSDYSRDLVYCMRCLSWPPQAVDWPTRQRNYGWPDSATVDCVVGNGCDVVRKAHRLCAREEWMPNTQYRMSFSRAEIVLLNSWMPVQQIVYHMLRVFVKAERLTESVDNSDATTLSNYHIKTLMLWASELKPRSWWVDDLNLVRLSVELLHTLAVWLTDARCAHYFIHNSNLFDHPVNSSRSPLPVASRLMLETRTSLAEWFINNYLRRCAHICPDSVSGLIDISNRTELKNAISAVADWRCNILRSMSPCALTGAQYRITSVVSCFSLTVRFRSCWMRDLMMADQRLCIYFTAIIFLHVAYKTTKNPLTDELLDVLLATCLQSNDARRFLNARRSSVLSLSQAAKLMKVIVNNSRSTVQLIEIELSKAYLYRALRCKDSDSDSIYCLANVYLAVLYYTTGHYQKAIKHCTPVTRSQDHSQCSSHVVEGELLPKIDDDIDTVLGLAVFYQYLRTAGLRTQQTQHVSVFTTELFAHYLHIRCLPVTTECHQFTKTSSTDKFHSYRKCFYDSQQIFPTDLLLLNCVNRPEYPTNVRRHVVVSGQAMPGKSQQLDTSQLVELLQHSAVEHLTTFRQLEAQLFNSIVTTDFEALYAYKHGEYQSCLQLSTDNVLRELLEAEGISGMFSYPEFTQLMDDDIVSLIGLTLIVNPSCRDNHLHATVRQLYLSLYLMTQCQIKLRHSVTSLAQTLDYVEDARRKLDDDFTLDPLLLRLTERKLQLHISTQFV